MERPVTFSRALVRRTTSPWAVWLSIAWGAVAAALALWGWYSAGRFGILATFFAMASFSLLAVLHQRRLFLKHEVTPVRVDEASLSVGETVVPRADITRAWHAPTSGRSDALVRIERRRGESVELLVDTPDEVRALLVALGHDAASRAFEVRGLGWPAAASTPMGPSLGIVLAGLTTSAALAAFGAPLPALPFVAAVAVSAVPSRVRVGADGLLLRWLWLERFVPVASIEAAERYEEGDERQRTVGVRLTLTSGEVLSIPLGRNELAVDDAAALVERVDAVRALHREAREVSEAERLARGERDAAEWLRALRAMGAGAGEGYRQATVDRDALCRVLESASSTPEARAAAAAALTASRDDRDVTRVRVASDAVAEPRLRVALDAAATGDDAALARALDVVSRRER